MVAVMGLSLYLSYAIKTSKFGLGLLAIGQNEDVAAILGVPTSLYKALVYSASAFLPDGMTTECASLRAGGLPGRLRFGTR